MVRDAAEALAAAIESIDGLRVRGQGINQVVVEAVDAAGESDPARTSAVLAAVVADGRCYPSGTVWQGRPGIRLSVSNWRTRSRRCRRDRRRLCRRGALARGICLRARSMRPVTIGS